MCAGWPRLSRCLWYKSVTDRKDRPYQWDNGIYLVTSRPSRLRLAYCFSRPWSWEERSAAVVCLALHFDGVACRGHDTQLDRSRQSTPLVFGGVERDGACLLSPQICRFHGAIAGTQVRNGCSYSGIALAHAPPIPAFRMWVATTDLVYQLRRHVAADCHCSKTIQNSQNQQ